MAFARFDDLWKLMTEYTFETVSDSREEDLSCMICKKIMVDSYQSPCGCQFCQKCIQEYLGGESIYCPGDKEECKEEHLLLERNVCRSVILNRKISRLRVNCPNEFCSFTEELTNMEDHLLLCTYQAVECPYGILGCDNQGGSKDIISTHLYEDSFTHNHLLIEYIQNMRNELSNFRNDTGNYENMNREMEGLRYNLEMTISEVNNLRDQSIIKENDIEELKKDVLDLKNNCKNYEIEICSLKEESIIKENTLKEVKKEVLNLKSELQKAKLEISLQKEQSIINKNEIDKIKKDKQERNSQKEKSLMNENKIKELGKEISDLKVKDDIKSLEDRSIVNERERERQNSEIKLLKERNEGKRKSDEERDNKINILIVSSSNTLSKSLNVDFVWRFEGISKKRDQRMFSESFVSNNYRLCLYLWVESDYHGGRILLGIVIMKGEKDNEVEWPLRRTLKVSLLDQDSLSSVQTLTFSCDTQLEYTGRPTTERNDIMCDSLSFDFSSLKGMPSVLVRDSLLISGVLSDP